MPTRVLVGVAVGGLLLAGCTTGAPPVPNPTGPGARLLVAEEQSTSTQDAAIPGVLGVDSAGCVTVGDLTLVAPAGSELINGTTVRLAGLGDYALGEELPVVSGGVQQAAAAEPYLQGCEASSLAFVMGP